MNYLHFFAVRFCRFADFVYICAQYLKIYNTTIMKILRRNFVAALLCIGITLGGSLAGCSSDEPKGDPILKGDKDKNEKPEEDTSEDPMDDEHVVIAYVSAWSTTTPNPSYMTHINYAFGHVSDSFNSVKIDNPDKLKTIAALKNRNPKLKVLLSLGCHLYTTPSPRDS